MRLSPTTATYRKGNPKLNKAGKKSSPLGHPCADEDDLTAPTFSKLGRWGDRPVGNGIVGHEHPKHPIRSAQLSFPKIRTPWNHSEVMVTDGPPVKFPLSPVSSAEWVVNVVIDDSDTPSLQHPVKGRSKRCTAVDPGNVERASPNRLKHMSLYKRGDRPCADPGRHRTDHTPVHDRNLWIHMKDIVSEPAKRVRPVRTRAVLKVVSEVKNPHARLTEWIAFTSPSAASASEN
jgi:hypothetical protein